jgi:hypothetical protein
MCICDFPKDCAGLGVLFCDGCGGDLCVCRCGGEMDCPGCECCATTLDLDDWDGEGEDVDREPIAANAPAQAPAKAAHDAGN